jgi:hypothetical protein
MEFPVTANVETSYGTLLARCSNRRRIDLGTVAGSESVADSVVLCRVSYTLRLSIVRIEALDASGSSGWLKEPAELPCLAENGWAATNEAVNASLLRRDWTEYRKSGPSEAARRELREQLIPQLAAWLATPQATALVSAGEAAGLDEVASKASQKAEVLQAAAAELTATAAMARRGDDLPDALRQAVLYGYRLEQTWEPPTGRPA